MTWKRRWCARRLLAAAPRILLPAVGFYLIALGAAPYVRAEVDARMIEVGANLLDVEGTMPELAGERVLVFNGARVVMLSGSSRLSVAAVLEHFQGYCTPAASEGFSRFLRGGDDRRGYVACLDRLAAASSGELLRVLGDVALDGLAAAGSVRYFYAERRGDTTLYIAATLEGGLDVKRLFPADGDAPGADLRGIARPAGSRRILSAHQEGQPYQVALYVEARVQPGELMREYRRKLAADGWRILEGRARPDRSQGGSALFVEKGGRLVALVFARGRTGTSLAVVAGL
jgi:hypothetical protein